jgi:Acetyltransferase (GNAT) domain
VGDRVAAFNWNLFLGDVYYFLFAGLDYDLNPSLDLYFNLMYAEMDCAFRAGAESLVFGQTTDDFKARLGCDQDRRFFYVTPTGFFGFLILKVAGDFLLPEPPRPPIHHVFRDPEPVSHVRSR